MREQMGKKHQCWIYLVCIGLGLALGVVSPALADVLEQLLWPLLGLLMYTTFTQIPLLSVARGLTDGRFMTVLLAGNFIAIPAFLGLVVAWLPALTCGIGLVSPVLLVPCTDWFIKFYSLGQGRCAPRCRGRSAAATGADGLLYLLISWLFLGSEWFHLGTLHLTNRCLCGPHPVSLGACRANGICCYSA